MNLKTSEINQFRKDLTEQLIKLNMDITQTKKESKPVTLDQQAFGRVSRIDAIGQQQMQVSALRRMETRLKMIQTALKRIEDNEYGSCLICEEAISLKRLKARPESPVCIQCAEKAKA